MWRLAFQANVAAQTHSGSPKELHASTSWIKPIAEHLLHLPVVHTVLQVQGLILEEPR